MSSQDYKVDNTGTVWSYDLKTYGPWVDVRRYASINAAVTAIGSDNKTLVVPNAQTLTTSLTVPSNIHLVILKGGSIVKASTYTLTINGPFEAGLYQVFSGFSAGGITFAANSIKELYPQWWGAKGDGVTNDAPAINAMFTSARAMGNARVKFPPGNYLVETGINAGGFLNNVIQVEGSGYRYAGTAQFNSVITGKIQGGVVFDFIGNEHGSIMNLAICSDVTTSMRPDCGLLLGGALSSTNSTRGGANYIQNVTVSGQYFYAAIANFAGDNTVFDHVVCGNEVTANNWLASRMACAINISNPRQLLRDENDATPDVVPYDLTKTQWVKTNMTAVQNQTGPDGFANSATLLTATAAEATVIANPGTFDALTAAYAAKDQLRRFVTYIKRISGTGSVSISQGGGYSDITSQLSPNVWKRVEIIESRPSPTANIKLAASGDQIAVWGSKLERMSWALTSDYYRMSNGTGLANWISRSGLYSIVDDVNQTGALKTLKNRVCILFRGISSAVYMYGDYYAIGSLAESPVIEYIESGNQLNIYGARHEGGTVEGSFIKTDGFSNSLVQSLSQGVLETYPLLDVDYNYHGLGSAGANGYISSSILRMAPTGAPSGGSRVWLVKHSLGRASIANCDIMLANGISINLPGIDSFFYGNKIHMHDDNSAGFSEINTHGDATKVLGNILLGNYGVQYYAAGVKGAKIINHLSATMTWNPASIANNASQSQDVLLPGAAVGDTVVCGFPMLVGGSPQSGMSISGSVYASGVVRVTIANNYGSAVDLDSGTLRVDVWKH